MSTGRRARRGLGGAEGMSTVEAAIAVAALLAVVLLCLGALSAATLRIGCVDAAREGARLAARGDPGARQTAADMAPDGARVQITRTGQTVQATVTVRAPLVPMVSVTGRASAAVEPDGADGAAMPRLDADPP